MLYQRSPLWPFERLLGSRTRRYYCWSAKEEEERNADLPASLGLSGRCREDLREDYFSSCAIRQPFIPFPLDTRQIQSKITANQQARKNRPHPISCLPQRSPSAGIVYGCMCVRDRCEDRGADWGRADDEVLSIPPTPPYSRASANPSCPLCSSHSLSAPTSD